MVLKDFAPTAAAAIAVAVTVVYADTNVDTNDKAYAYVDGSELMV